MGQQGILCFSRHKADAEYMDKKLLSEIADFSQDPIYACTEEYLIVYMNRTMAEICGGYVCGGTCFKEIYNNEKICAWCNNSGISKEESLVIELAEGQQYVMSRKEVICGEETRIYINILRQINDKTCNNIASKPQIEVDIDFIDRRVINEMLNNLSRAVEQCANSIVITDTEGTIEYVNPNFVRMTGYGLNELVGKNPYKDTSGLILPDIFSGAWNNVKEGGEWRGEQQSKRKNGQPFWESVAISPIKNADDVVTHFLAISEDITIRKNTEKELQKSKAELVTQHEKLQNLFYMVERAKKEWESSMDCIADIVILTDIEGRIRRCNKALYEITESEHRDLAGMKWRDVLSNNGLSMPSECVSGTEINHAKSGRWFVLNAYPFSDGIMNTVPGKVVTLHDVTEVKRFTNELERAYSDLKTTQAKVVQQEKMASIGQLAAGVAHEINNPMGFISSNLGTLAKYVERMREFIHAQSEIIETMQTGEAHEKLLEKRKCTKIDFIMDDCGDLIRESLEGAERVRTIVQNMKGFSRLDEAECKQADINECITSTINIVWNELKYKAKVVKELGKIPSTKCLPQQLNQVFLNLLMNAVQAIAKQGEIVAKTWHDNGSIFVSVSDSGCGMTPTVVNRIFEPFFTTKEVGKGTGLGLSITYDIVKKHHGEIMVHSEPGRGSTFTVRLPVLSG